MGRDVLVTMEIPIEPEPLEFYKWLPTQEENRIIVEEEGKRLVLWFDINCAGGTFDKTEEEILRYLNIPARKVYAEITIVNVREELIGQIINISNNLKEIRKSKDLQIKYKNDPLQKEYEDLGKTVLEFTLKYVNRLITFCRVEKGQYQLEEIEIDVVNMRSAFIKYKSRVSIESNWYHWHPSFAAYMISVTLGSNTDRLIDTEDWDEIKRFVKSERSPNLVLELLANAERLTSLGLERNALIDAVTALEIKVTAFSRRPDIENLQSITGINKKLNLGNLKNTVEHLGFSSTVHYLLPIIFDEGKLPYKMIQDCQEAITERQNIVHNGKRKVDSRKINSFLTAIRGLCRLLDKYSLHS